MKRRSLISKAGAIPLMKNGKRQFDIGELCLPTKTLNSIGLSKSTPQLLRHALHGARIREWLFPSPAQFPIHRTPQARRNAARTNERWHTWRLSRTRESPTSPLIGSS